MLVNCCGNAVAESFLNLLMCGRIRRRTREDAFDCIEMFCTPKRKHARSRMLSPAECERQQKIRREGR